MLDYFPIKVEGIHVLATVASGTAVEAFPVRDSRTKPACFKAFALKKFPQGSLDAVRVATKGERLPLFGMALDKAGIGSVNCGQRLAIATTRTTGCSLSGDGCGGRIAAGTAKQTSGSQFRSSRDESGCRHHHSENIRWSSRPRPVNRLQATSQPKSCESRRRVMRGGSKGYTLGSKEQDRLEPVVTQGKLSLSPKNSGSEYRSSTVPDSFPLSVLHSFSSTRTLGE